MLADHLVQLFDLLIDNIVLCLCIVLQLVIQSLFTLDVFYLDGSDAQLPLEPRQWHTQKQVLGALACPAVRGHPGLEARGELRGTLTAVDVLYCAVDVVDLYQLVKGREFLIEGVCRDVRGGFHPLRHLDYLHDRLGGDLLDNFLLLVDVGIQSVLLIKISHHPQESGDIVILGLVGAPSCHVSSDRFDPNASMVFDSIHLIYLGAHIFAALGGFNSFNILLGVKVMR